MNIRDYNPAHGMAFQGDVSIIPVPFGIAIATVDEIKPVDGRLILQEGELTGHHHAIRVRNFRAATALTGDPALATRDPKLKQKFGGARIKAAPRAAIELGGARLFRDRSIPFEMVRRGILTRADLSVGVLVVEKSNEPVVHEEHDAIRLLAGNGRAGQPDLTRWMGGYAFQLGRYLIGRQVENAGAEERRVAD